MPAASAAGDASTIDSSTNDSAARYSFTTRPRPTKIARLMSAWPIDTSSRCGSVLNSVRFFRSRSCPALTPTPSSKARFDAAAYFAKLADAAVRAALERPRERLGVQLDAIGAHRLRPSNRGRLRIDKQADANAVRLQRPDDARERIGRRVGGPAGFARNLAGLHRHERALIGLDREHQVEKTRPRIAFDVELDAALERRQLVGDLVHVGGRDVALRRRADAR